MREIRFWVDDELHEHLKVLSTEAEMSLADFMRMLINDNCPSVEDIENKRGRMKF